MELLSTIIDLRTLNSQTWWEVHYKGKCPLFLMYSTDIPASVHGMSACALLFTHPWIRCQQTKPSTPMSHVVYEPQLRSVFRSSMHPCPGNWVAIKHAVVYHARASHAFSAGFKCRLCILRSNVITISLRLCVENEKQ